MSSGSAPLCLMAAVVTFLMAACATASQSELRTGMTPDQAIAALGTPDLTDSVPDPANRGAKLLRYTWVEAGKTATFGPDNHLSSISSIEVVSSAASTPEPTVGSRFDPLSTPINYAFYPLRAAFIWLGAGLNCVAQGQCQKPALPSPSAG